MEEIARGMKVFDHAPVRGLWRTFRSPEDVAAADGDDIVAVVRDPGAVWLRALAGRLVAIVCTTGTPRSHVGILAGNLGVPCVVAAEPSGGAPLDGTVVEVDCSGDVGIVRA